MHSHTTAIPNTVFRQWPSRCFNHMPSTVKTLNAADVESAPRRGETSPLSHEEVTVHSYSGILSHHIGWLVTALLWDIIIPNKPGRIAAWHNDEACNRGLLNGSRGMRWLWNWANGGLSCSLSMALRSIPWRSMEQPQKNSPSLLCFWCPTS